MGDSFAQKEPEDDRARVRENKRKGMGRNLENTSALMNVASSGNPGEVGMRIVGLQGIMKKSESELNLEAFLCMSGEGEGQCPDGGLGIKGANASDKTSGDFLQEKSPSDHALGGGALVDDPGSKDNFSSCGQPTELGWCPSPALRGSSPASTGGSGLTYGCNNSGERSDDEDDVETEAGQCEESIDGNESKRMRRMVSNRESARRSRRRKQAHLNELESQVDQLRGENSSLFKQLTEISQRCNDAASNNLILKSDVEALRSTVKMSQDLIATGPLANIVNQHLLQQPSITPPPTSWNMCRPFDIPLVLDSSCCQDASSLTETLTIESERSGADIKLKTDGSLSMQRTTNMEQLQNHICGAADTWPWDTSPMTKPC